jgi:hypothetical protein
MTPIDSLRTALAALKLAERGTDNGWVDDAAVEQARIAVLREAKAFVRAEDAIAESGR